MRLLTIAAVLACCGCSGESGDITITGRLLLDGIPTAGEILIDPVEQKEIRTPSPVTVFADADGRFSATIIGSAESSDHLPCRLVLRASPPSDGQVPTVFDEQAQPEKTVTLHRDLGNNAVLTLLVTQ